MWHFNYLPGDVLVFLDENKSLFGRLRRWLLGFRYGHVALYFTETKHGLHLVIESIGRGVAIRALMADQGSFVFVLRLREDDGKGQAVAKQAERLADNPQSWYDYFGIVRWVIPRLILAKLGIRTRDYQRNQYYICSELVAEAFWRAGIQVVPRGQVPLPGDFMESPLLRLVAGSRL